MQILPNYRVFTQCNTVVCTNQSGILPFLLGVVFQVKLETRKVEKDEAEEK